MKNLEREDAQFQEEMADLKREYEHQTRLRRQYGVSEVSFNEYLQAALVSERRVARQRAVGMQSSSVTPVQTTTRLVELLFGKLPEFSADWDRDFQEQWWDVIQTLLDLIHPLSMTEVTLTPLPMDQSFTETLIDLMGQRAGTQTEADQEVTGDGGA